MGEESMKNNRRNSPFNSSIETGVRAIILLEAIYPKAIDLSRIVEYDYLMVHSEDAGGPESLHASLPFRTGEILVRRHVIESGLLLMMSRNLISQIPTTDGLKYVATDNAYPFVTSLNSLYIKGLKNRAGWVVAQFGNYSDDDLVELTKRLFNKWTTQFQHSKESKRDT